MEHELLEFLPSGISGVMAAIFILYMRFVEKRSAENRTEHVTKWEMMLARQEEESKRHDGHINALIESFNAHAAALVSHHASEKELLFRLHERNTAALESLNHKISIKLGEGASA